MADINRIDEKKRRVGPYGGALVGAGGALTAAAGALANAPAQAYNALAAGFSRGGPGPAALPDPSSVLAKPQPLAAAAKPAYDMSADVGVTGNRVPVQPLAQGRQAIDAPMTGPTLYEAGANTAMQNTQVNGNSFDLAGQNARMRAALDANNGPVATPSAADGPRPNDVGMYAGPADAGGTSMLEFKQQNALDRVGDGLVRNKAGRQLRDLSGLAAAAGYGELIKDKQKYLANQGAIDSYAKNALSFANAGESVGRAANARALVPSEIGLKDSQAQENLARVPLSLAQAGEARARGNSISQLLPSQIGLNQANAGEAQARGGLYGAQASNMQALLPGQVEGQSLANALSQFTVKDRQELDGIFTRLGKSTDPKQREQLQMEALTRMGKTDPDRYEVRPIAKTSDMQGDKSETFGIFDKKTGKIEPIPAVNAGPPKNAATGAIMVDGKGNKVKFDGKQWVAM